MSRTNKSLVVLALVAFFMNSALLYAAEIDVFWRSSSKKPKKIIVKKLDDREFKLRLDSLLSFERARAFPLREVGEVEEGPCFEVISDNLEIKCNWVKDFDYFGTWDKWNVDPYKIDPLKLNTPLSLQLCDKEDSSTWSFPIEKGRVTSGFGWRRYRYHYGIDMKLSKGDSVKAAFDGIVRIAKYNRGGYGYYVLIRHKNGLETIYGHLSKYIVISGQEVKAGELIGYGGSTGRSSGNHLHFELRYQGNPINPEEFYNLEDIKLLSDQYQIDERTYAYVKEIRKRAYHRIRRGDYLGRIARRYHTSVRKICRLNKINTKTTLRVGRKLRVR